MKKLEEIFEYLKHDPTTADLIQLSEDTEIESSDFPQKFTELAEIFKYLEAKFNLAQQAFDHEVSENKQWMGLLDQRNTARYAQPKDLSMNSTFSTKKSGNSFTCKSLSAQLKSLEQKLGTVSEQSRQVEEVLSIKQETLKQLEVEIKSLRLENAALEPISDSTESLKKLNDQIQLNRKLKEKIQMLSCFEEVVDGSITEKLEEEGLLPCFQEVLGEHELLSKLADLQSQIEHYEKLLITCNKP